MISIQFETDTLTKGCLMHEDGGTVILLELSDGKEVEEGAPYLFVRVHSVDEGEEHRRLAGALGKRFKVTIEEIEAV